MSLIERTISVSFRHQVHFTRNAFGLGNPVLRNILAASPGAIPRALVVLDESLHEAQPALAPQIETYFKTIADCVQLVAPPIILEGGERVKNSYFHVSEIQSHLDRHHIDRHSYLLAAGGGALLDLVGLAAATAHRGVRHVRLPSTTLSQADSGVGVKNGMNAFGKKNFIGTFAVPWAVINDFDLLATLPPRDKRAGYIEAVKVACIRDAAFFERLEQDAAALARCEPAAMEHLIERCAELHLNHIATGGDPFELGSARPLDFGHWAAHKLEPLSEYRLRHGEAVAIGIALDVIYSRRIGLLEAAAAERILHLIETLGFDLFAPELGHRDADGIYVVLKGLEEFREHLGGQLTLTLLQAIGRGVEVHEVHFPTMLESIRELEQRRPARGQGGLVSLVRP
ncbi:MAG: 3-dehydroquinate synthase [Verrucomicrobiota bacterium]|jgi:3-dehydroquinate synthase